MVDTKTNISFDTICFHEDGINSLIFLKNGINFISGARKDNNVHLWDIRKTNKPLVTFYRNGQTNQKLDILVDKEENCLFIANVVKIKSN